MTGNFFAALKQIKDGGNGIDKGVPYLFLYALLEVSDVIFTRSINKAAELDWTRCEDKGTLR